MQEAWKQDNKTIKSERTISRWISDLKDDLKDDKTEKLEINIRGQYYIVGKSDTEKYVAHTSKLAELLTTYDDIKDKIKIGQAVLVPFGRQGLVNAFVVGFSDYLAGDFKVKKISKIIDETPLFSIDYLKLLEWVANYYCCDLVTVLNAAIPMKLIEKASKTETLIEFEKYDGATKRQTEILKLLEQL